MTVQRILTQVTIAGVSALAIWPTLAAPGAHDNSIEDEMYRQDVTDWRAKAEASLRKDNGWLTLAGRYVMKPGENRFGTALDNDIVFPAGTGPAHIGTLLVEPDKVTLKVNDGLTMLADGKAFTARQMGTDVEKRDWVSIGQLAMHVIARDGCWKKLA